MSSQQQQQIPPTLNPQGYAPLSEEESYSPSGQPTLQHPPSFLGQGTPVIVQGLPVMPMSYPAPMGNFEIYNPAPSQLQKLDSCPYVCYKYWLAICIVLNGLSIFNTLATLLLLPSQLLIFYLCSCILRGWDIYQLIQVYVGIQDRILEKVNKGIFLMKIYLVGLAVFYLVFTFSLYELLMEIAKKNDIRELQDLPLSVFGVGVAIIFLMSGSLWFLIILFPAMKVRDILKTASGGQGNARHYANV